MTDLKFNENGEYSEAVQALQVMFILFLFLQYKFKQYLLFIPMCLNF